MTRVLQKSGLLIVVAGASLLIIAKAIARAVLKPRT